MRPVVFAVAGPLDARTGGSIYNRRMVEELRALGWTVTVIELEGDFPEPAPAARAAAARAFDAVPQGSTVVVDGLAFSALPEIAEIHARRLALVAMVHLPIGAAFGLDAGTAERLEAAERRALGHASAIVITGPGARPLLLRYGLTGNVPLVEPGTDPAPIAHGSAGGALNLLCVATVSAGKGHDLLIEALAPLLALEWDLSCAGSLTRDPETVERLRALAVARGLIDRVHFIGEVAESRLSRCYAEADIVALATRQETYGMAVAEAIAHGLPVVSTHTGAIADLVGDAGVVVPPGDGDAFAEALAAVMKDSGLRRRLAERARVRRAALPTWGMAAAKLATVLQEVTARG